VNRTAAKALFHIIEKWRREPVIAFLSDLKRNQHRPRGELREIQRKKLELLLAYVTQHNEYYRAKYSGRDLLTDFETLPVLTKAELRENYERIVTKGFEGKLDLVKTSGSTGMPLKFYRDRVVFGHTMASVLRAHDWYGLPVGSMEAMLWGIPASRLNRLKMRSRDFVLNRFRESEYNLDPGVLADFYRKMVLKRPDYLYGYSSMVYEFALFLHESRYPAQELRLKAVVCTAESIHAYQRETMERVFGCKVVSEYGSAETGIIAYECPYGSHHISDDCVYVEVVDENNRPLPPGEVGNVTVTVLHSQAAPIIRYQLGDFASLSDGQCQCGVSLSLLEKLVGRTSGIIVTPHGRCFHSIVLYYVMKDYAEKFGGIRQFKVRQTHVDRLEFHLVTTNQFGSHEQQWIAQQVQARLGDGMHLDFVLHDRIDRSASGKLSDFESDLPADQRLISSFRGPAGDAFAAS
jgi:phenylacetate-CoA ligase